MPNIGDTARAKDVGVGTTSHKVVWLPCEACSAERWVWLRRGEPQSRWCYPCGRREGKPRGSKRGESHWHWKGGRSITKQGYVEVWVPDSSPFRLMGGKDGYVYEHRLVVAQSLGRCLESGEEVHHVNADKHDNRLSNLRVLSKGEHAREHHAEVGRLREEVRRLREQLREARPS